MNLSWKFPRVITDLVIKNGLKTKNLLMTKHSTDHGFISKPSFAYLYYCCVSFNLLRFLSKTSYQWYTQHISPFLTKAM